MTISPLERLRQTASQVVRFVQRRRWELALVGLSTVAAALVGLGLAHSLQGWLASQPGLVGAVVAAVVALVVLPLALWVRVPPAARLNLVRPAAAPSVSSLPAPLAPVAPAAVAASAAPASAGMTLNLTMPAAATGPGDVVPGTVLTNDAQRPVRDALTGAYTQQHFVAAADREWSRIRRHGEDAALLMIDIDRLKGINDRFGTGCGDALLVEITRQVSTTLRQYDLLARFGGGVLVVYLPHTDPIGALDVAERIRERVAALRVSWSTHTLRSTVSVGVASIGASHGALDEVIADAGGALREAKAAGRNCVRAAPVPPRRSVHPYPSGAKRPAGPM